MGKGKKGKDKGKGKDKDGNGKDGKGKDKGKGKGKDGKDSKGKDGGRWNDQKDWATRGDSWEDWSNNKWGDHKANSQAKKEEEEIIEWMSEATSKPKAVTQEQDDADDHFAKLMAEEAGMETNAASPSKAASPMASPKV